MNTNAIMLMFFYEDQFPGLSVMFLSSAHVINNFTSNFINLLVEHNSM